MTLEDLLHLSNKFNLRDLNISIVNKIFEKKI